MKVVGYVRLSRDEDKENYSSIITQKSIIEEYSNNKNWTVNKIYVDDNCSGYSFDRPEFSRMLLEIEKGRIDVVISKDLSRIGRNNGKVLMLIDRLRELNVRLILVEEARGGLDLLEDNSDILGIKTWYNEMYIKDISRKIRSSMGVKQKKGELIMGNFYGYRKIKINNNFKLVVDEEIRPIIQLIFKKYIEGLGYKKICDLLDKKGCPTPSEYIQRRYEKIGRVFKNSVSHRWQVHMVNRIIKNDLYIGTLRTRKRQSRIIKGKQERVSKENQYVFKNNHEAIISREEFDLAQEINLKRKGVSYSGNSKYNYVFSSFMKCGECGYAAIGCSLKTSPVNVRGYNCTMYNKYGNKRCSNHAITEDKVLFFYKEFLKDLLNQYKADVSNLKVRQSKNYVRKSLDRLQKELDIANEELKLILFQKIKDLASSDNKNYKVIVENTYLKIEDEKKKMILNITEKIKELMGQEKDKLKSDLDIFEDLINSKNPNHASLERIFNRIIIYKDGNLEFKLKMNIDRLT